MLLFADVNKKLCYSGGRLAGTNDFTQGQTKSTGVPPKQKVNKAGELTYISSNIVAGNVYGERCYLLLM